MTSEDRLLILTALIGKLPTFELMWPDAVKDRWFATFERLRATALGEDDKDTIDQRDYAQDMADELATRIVTLTTGGDAVDAIDVIGEHTSANCPWKRAIELADEHIAERELQKAERSSAERQDR